MEEPRIRLKIYGARGSYSPTDGQASTIGVNTTCLRADIGNNVVVFDAGSGIINLGRDLLKEIHGPEKAEYKWKINLFFTHMHIDHLCGFPYFAMLYFPKSEIHFMGPKILDYDLAEVLDSFMHPPLFPVSMSDLPFQRRFYEILENVVVYFYDRGFELRSITDPAPQNWICRITTMRNYMHPKGGSYFYKMETDQGKSVVFASDTEGYVGGDQRLCNFAKGADLLLHDAQYLPEDYGKYQGFGHSTYQMACDVAQQAGVKELLLIHHDPTHNDDTLRSIEKAAQSHFAATRIASESMTFDV